MVIKELFAKLGFDFDENAFAKAQAALSGINKGLAIVAATAAGAAAGFVYMMGTVADAAFEVKRAAEAAGVNTQALQELQYAAKVSGTSSEVLAHGMRHLALMLIEAKQGSVEAAYALQQAGVNAHGANGQFKSVDMILTEMAEKFSKMPDGIQKTGYAMKVFGRAGNELIPFLNKGKEGIAALRKEAEDLGIVMSDDLIKRSEEYRKSGIRLSAALQGLKLALVGPLLGTSKIKEAIVQWIIANKAIIASGFQKFVEGLSKAAYVLGQVLLAAYGALVLIKEGGAPAILAVAASFVYLKRVAVQAAIESALAWGAAALPFVAIGAAILAVILLLDDLRGYLAGEDSAIGLFIDAMKDAFSDFFKWWDKKIEEMVETLRKALIKKFPRLSFLLEGGKEAEESVNNVSGKATTATVDALTGGLFSTLMLAGKNANGLFGGGASPQASALVSGVLKSAATTTLGAFNVHINVDGSGDPTAVADKVVKHFNDQKDKMLREANAAVGGAR